VRLTVRYYIIVSVVVTVIVWCLLSGWFWNRPVYLEHTEMLMDTSVTVKVYVRDKKVGERLLKDAFHEARRIERIMEPFKGDGEVKCINNLHEDCWIPISPDLKMVLNRSQLFYELTGGAFDPTLGVLKLLWDFENGGTLPPADAIEKSLKSVGLSHSEMHGDSIHIENREMRFDFGGVAGGYVVDRMIALLKEGGAYAGLVNDGGDIETFGKKPDGNEWVIGVRHPREDRVLQVAPLSLLSVSTSGDYERFFMKNGIRYHHILDPSTGYPARGCISVTVWAACSIDADILSTAIFVLGPKKGLTLAENRDGVEALIFYEEGNSIRYVMTSGIKGKVTVN
jgi:FAD:protein FMN transferase